MGFLKRFRRSSRYNEESYYLASQWQLMWRKFRLHRMAIVGGSILLALYILTGIAGFISPYEKASRDKNYVLAPPQKIRVFHEGEFLGPFVYKLERTRDPETLQRIYTEETGTVSYTHLTLPTSDLV